MIKVDNIRYKAEEGCFIIRKEDRFIMGEDICLGDNDSIDNYEDHQYTLEEYEEFYNPNRVSFDEVMYNKLIEIRDYDTSSNVNLFFINDAPLWLDRTSRTSLMARFNAEQSKGIETTNLWYESMNLVLPIKNAIEMLLDLEIYASQCYDVTQRHLHNVKQLQSIEDINNYDYKVDYPEKLKLII